MKKRFAKKLILFILAGTLTIGLTCVAAASDAETTKPSTEGLEEYIRELLLTLDAANTTLDQLYNEMAELDVKIAENQIALVAATESAESQYKQMLKRIKYFYEAGANMDVLEAIFSAKSIGDAINKSSYINRVVDYDREMLVKYKNTIDTINNLQLQLIHAKERLEQAKAEFEAKNAEVLQTVEEIPENMENLGVPPEEIGRVIEDVREDLEESGELPTEPEPEVPTETTTQLIEEPTTTEPSEDLDDPEEPDPGKTKDPEWGFSEEEIYTMARVTYLENGCIYPEGSYRSVYLTACVILNRANNWYGGSINAAIYATGQYATAYKYDNWGGGPLTINDITWEAVYDALSNCDPNPYYQCNGQHLAGMGLTEYYRDPVTDEVFYYSYDNAP